MLALVAEAAAHVRRDDPEIAFGKAELGAYVAADVVRRLRPAIQGVRRRDHAARLDGAAAQAVIHQLDLDYARRPAERRLDRRGVAAGPAEATLALDRRQRLVVDFDRFGGVL